MTLLLYIDTLLSVFILNLWQERTRFFYIKVSCSSTVSVNHRNYSLISYPDHFAIVSLYLYLINTHPHWPVAYPLTLAPRVDSLKGETYRSYPESHLAHRVLGL